MKHTTMRSLVYPLCNINNNSMSYLVLFIKNIYILERKETVEEIRAKLNVLTELKKVTMLTLEYLNNRCH